MIIIVWNTFPVRHTSTRTTILLLFRKLRINQCLFDWVTPFGPIDWHDFCISFLFLYVGGDNELIRPSLIISSGSIHHSADSCISTLHVSAYLVHT